jgi:hypothetical protein
MCIDAQRLEYMQQRLEFMRQASDTFYSQAMHIGVHPFIEFTGLINEYIKICSDNLEAGVDFIECSKHTGNSLIVKDYQIEYINEKLECIFNGLLFAESKESKQPKKKAKKNVQS